jgi:type IV pilus assembly protein PilY1
MKKAMKKLLSVVMLFVLSNNSFSEDIELYIGDAAQQAGTKPQVLIIFDNSGSMNTDQLVKSPYEPDTIYPALQGDNSLSERFVYFTKGTGVDSTIPIPGGPNESRRFLDDINSCATAREKLATVGFYTGHIREYTFQGQSGSWQEIPDNNGANIEVIDCKDDIDLENPDNAHFILPNSTEVDLPDGYPKDALGNKNSPIYHSNDGSGTDVVWSGQVVTLYTDNYLRWAHNEDIAEINRSRLDIAKDAVTNLIESVPSANFGLQIFNYDHPGENVRDGGRIIAGIKDMTETDRANLADLIDLDIDGETNTPLCESLYEAARYFGGKSVDFGDNDSNYQGRYTGNTPVRDTSIESDGNYISPFNGCTNEIFVIMITDGKPTQDLAANTDIASFPNMGTPFTINSTSNYLAALSGWMHTNDINDNLPDKQIATISTVGFALDDVDAVTLLQLTASTGGGQYYDAENPDTLGTALSAALSNILEVDTSFTAPSVASNNFDRTETLDSVYYAMFVPERGARWQGNLKKLKVVGAEQLDKNGASAIDDEGNISDDATTYWSSANDGNDVKKGGVVELFSSINLNLRNIISNLGTNGALVDFSRENAELTFSGSSGLATELNVLEDDIDTTLAWVRGYDTDDDDGDDLTNDNRADIFGDPLHSKPLVLNYGGSSTEQDVRIIVGTNSGVLHMFDDNGASVSETWAFMPKEFFPKIKKLKDNFASSSKVYGIDGTSTSYIFDENGDGSINGNDKAWVFFGLRRGGSSYYALDVSEPSTPVLMWKIDASMDDFSELGQSWAKPKVAYSKLNTVNGVAKPVLFIGGGYDIAKDAAGVGGAAASDSVGRGIFMLDAETGALIWGLTPDISSDTNTQNTGITDSIPSSVAVLDSDLDGMVDRVYAGDTGGNVWRVDMPDSSVSNITSFKIASLGGNDPSGSDDRRFFNEPSIVRTFISDTISSTVATTDDQGVTTESVVITQQERPYDALLIGSGDRSTPVATDTSDMFFMIKDENIVSESYVVAATTPAPVIPEAITFSDLYNYTTDPFSSLSGVSLRNRQVAVSEKSGWYYKYEASGEKNTAAAIAINGTAYFTSFTPAAANTDPDSCELNTGQGSLYAIDLALGTTKYDWRKKEAISEGIPGGFGIIINQDPEVSVPPCTGDDCDAEDDKASIATIKLIVERAMIPLNLKLKTSRNYHYVTEN